MIERRTRVRNGQRARSAGALAREIKRKRVNTRAEAPALLWVGRAVPARRRLRKKQRASWEREAIKTGLFQSDVAVAGTATLRRARGDAPYRESTLR
jgi:hypothetical protein